MKSPPTPTANAVRKQGRWAPGKSGNPAGKAKGTRHRVTQAIEALLDGEAEQLTRKIVEVALAGDMTALRLCLDRIAPARRERPISIKLPKIKGISDHPAAITSIIEAVASGDLTPMEAQALSGILAEHRKAIETVDIEARLAALEGGSAR